jgi:hypothetical protein
VRGARAVAQGTHRGWVSGSARARGQLGRGLRGWWMAGRARTGHAAGARWAASVRLRALLGRWKSSRPGALGTRGAWEWAARQGRLGRMPLGHGVARWAGMAERPRTGEGSEAGRPMVGLRDEVSGGGMGWAG